MGLCEPWINGEDVADCCGVDYTTDTAVLLEDAAEKSSEVLFEASGRIYTGICESVVRPCRVGCGCFGYQILEGSGYVVPPVWWWNPQGWWMNDCGDRCGCDPVSRVHLAGYPVVSISQVKIDGAIIPASEYRLDEQRYLTRMADADGNPQAWPACQRMDLPATETGTFQISYTHGEAPTLLGIEAATEFACQLYRACPGTEGECELPAGVTKVVRQGVTVEVISSLAKMIRSGATGLPLVDSFIAAANPSGLRMRPAVYSPDVAPYPRPEGVTF